ncbi:MULTISPECIES: tyrosine-protein phosphatase [Mumia]|uniref:tyrosine-protein phosphatase n=1 Tax=Mumia TaxID=1546255 RepID=UPI00141E7CE2|nr:tyrosine-protein phosphatase [Mumia sp. ZJ1417]QMW67460.1 tyrosine-protein phosphatase [Mumia sp. ZJ1417]
MIDPATYPGASIPLETLPNLRGLGGWRTSDGRRVRDGVLYRSTDLSRLSGADLDAVAALGIRTVVDLRTQPERALRPDVVVPGAEHVVLDVLADDTDATPTDMATILEDPKRAKTLLGDGQVEELLSRAYTQLVALPSARTAYRTFFSDLLALDRGPVLFHCTTGKDRTGWAAATTLLMVGVPEEDVVREYLLTNDQLLPALKPVFDEFAAHGGDPALLRPVLGVREAYLETSMAQARTQYGDLATYFAEGLGVGPDRREALRDLLTEC